jgi:hypothetical protein
MPQVGALARDDLSHCTFPFADGALIRHAKSSVLTRNGHRLPVSYVSREDLASNEGISRPCDFREGENADDDNKTRAVRGSPDPAPRLTGCLQARHARGDLRSTFRRGRETRAERAGVRKPAPSARYQAILYDVRFPVVCEDDLAK